MSNYNYCPLAWYFCNEANTIKKKKKKKKKKKTEKNQERALKFMNDNYSSSLQSLLDVNKAIPLHINRIRLLAYEVFTILNKVAPSYIQDIINIKMSNYDFRGKKKSDTAMDKHNKIWAKISPV